MCANFLRCSDIASSYFGTIQQFFFFRTILIYLRGVYRFFIPRSKRSIEGEIGLVTGAGCGIGRQLALQLGRLGVIVICLDVDEESNNETVKLVEATGATAFGLDQETSILKAPKTKND